LGRKSSLVVLSYHSISNDSWQFSIDKETVEKQLLYLKKHYNLASPEDVADLISGKKEIKIPSVVLTFDDGYKDILTLKPFFTKHAIIPTLFVLGDSDHANWGQLDTKRPLLSGKEILSLRDLGWIIGCHSGTHANLTEVTVKELEKEVTTAKNTLEKLLNKKISYFAYPRGKHNSQVVDMLGKSGYTLAFTMDDGVINTTTNHLLVPRVGVDRTHTFAEFRVLFSPSVIRFRQIIKTSFLGRYL
ncbi:polysaccharide deacetylase family protein, partial [Candidatus Microgenomates bacterium]|nr:polysaccharide deacetylase family protein [Candidatus Microgenomates bacterium]